MTIFNLGSINIDHVYRVSSLPGPGETVSDKGYSVGLGGKGVNQSLAAAAAGARLVHIGAIGADGRWIAARLRQAGINTDHLDEIDAATGHAIVCVDDVGENQIVIHGGANRALSKAQIASALKHAQPGDWFLAQNETNLVPEGFAMARAANLKTAYSAAPFDPHVTARLAGTVDLLAINQIEAAQLAGYMGVAPEALPVAELLITLGSDGARYRVGGEVHEIAAFAVETVDTTGAGDTFLGAFLAARDQGEAPEAALRRAAAMAAIQVTRPGAADAIPTGAEVRNFLAEHGA